MSIPLDIGTRDCVAWCIQSPHFRGTLNSSTFFLDGFPCFLELRKSGQDCTALALTISGALNRRLLRQVQVTTLIDTVIPLGLPRVCSVTHVGGTSLLWRLNSVELSKTVPGYDSGSPFKIVCLFQGKVTAAPVSPLDTQPDHLSTTSDAKLSTPFDLAPDLQSLSLDLSNLLEDEDFPDAKLKCGEHTVSAHKAVLVSRSEVFSAMFRNKMKERETGAVDIQDMDIKVLQLFLKYVYSGKVEGLPDDLVPSLYSAGDRYAVHALKKACSERMVERLTEKNCVSLLTVADAHNDAAFKETVVSFICGHDTVLQSKVWLEFSGRHLRLANEVYQSYVTSKSKNR